MRALAGIGHVLAKGYGWPTSRREGATVAPRIMESGRHRQAIDVISKPSHQVRQTDRSFRG